VLYASKKAVKIKNRLQLTDS